MVGWIRLVACELVFMLRATGSALRRKRACRCCKLESLHLGRAIVGVDTAAVGSATVETTHTVEVIARLERSEHTWGQTSTNITVQAPVARSPATTAPGHAYDLRSSPNSAQRSVTTSSISVASLRRDGLMPAELRTHDLPRRGWGSSAGEGAYPQGGARLSEQHRANRD